MFDRSRSNSGIAALFYLYLLAISVAEFVTSLVHTETGVVLHLAVFGALVLHSTSRTHLRAILSLCLIPLIRIVSLGLPLGSFDQMWWFGLMAVPLIVTTVLVVHALGLGPSDIGVRMPRGNQWVLTIAVVASGVLIGVLLRTVSEPRFVIDVSGTFTVLVIAGVTVSAISFAEELIFRGLVQTVAASILGTVLGILCASFAFAVMQIGSQSPALISIAFAVGILWGYVRYRTGSLFGVIIASILVNAVYYGILG